MAEGMSLPNAVPEESSPAQQGMSAQPKVKKQTALQALADADLVCTAHSVESYDELRDLVKGEWSMGARVLASVITFPVCCHCCCQCRFFEVEPGCVRPSSAGDGTNIWHGPGVHAFFGLAYGIGQPQRVSEGEAIINGTKAIVTIQQGYVGLAFEKGEPIIL